MPFRSPCLVLELASLVFVSLTAGCAPSLQASTHRGVVSGTLSYRERMALPSDTVVEVRLSDVSLQDVAAPVIAETTFMPEGRQVPLPFEIRYDSQNIEPNRSYALRATIHSAGRMIFTTDTVYRVITQGNPTHADLMLVRVSEGVEAAPSGVGGTAWLLEDLGGTGVLDRIQATLEFPEPGKAVGNGSCNRFFGTVEVSSETMRFSRLGSTRMACAEAVAIQEGKYLKALEAAERFAIDGSVLLIYVKGMDKPLRFTRTAP